MNLGEAIAEDVLRNVSNSSYYRYVRPEDKRVRIRPLELFPNGLLIEKPTDTIVLPEIRVERIGKWEEGMVLHQAKGGKSRRSLEQERDQLEQKLVDLKAEKVQVPPALLGSHQNKINAAEARLSVLERGLAILPGSQQTVPQYGFAAAPDAVVANIFEVKDQVLLPSGRPGVVCGYFPRAGGVMADASVLVNQAGSMAFLQVDQGLLKPVTDRHIATV